MSCCTQVYISCSVMMCEAGNPNTRCAQGCQRSSPRRWKREAVSQSSLHFISQGPLRLRRSAELNEGSGKKTGSCFLWVTPVMFYWMSITVSPSCRNEPEPEPEPGLHCWMSPSSCCHGERIVHLQSQNVSRQIPTSAHVRNLGSRTNPNPKMLIF